MLWCNEHEIAGSSRVESITNGLGSQFGWLGSPKPPRLPCILRNYCGAAMRRHVRSAPRARFVERTAEESDESYWLSAELPKISAKAMSNHRM
jgi:hypothetical protein